MCGRYTLRTPLAQVGSYFDVRETVELPQRFNIAPTQDVPVVRLAKGSPERELVPLRWGLIPFWAKDPSVGSRNINARGETVAEKPTFRSAFQRRRCLIPADGFYEWTKAGGKTRQPHYIHLRSDEPFAFAGLWEIWGEGDQRIQSFSIITTAANDLLRPLHDRMPVILPQRDHALWLDREFEDLDRLSSFLQPYPSREMEHYTVDTRVNSPKNDEPECIEHARAQKTLPGFD